MTTLLAGIHDREGAHLVPPGGWCVDTVHVWEQPPADYTRLGGKLNWIVRLNNGYGSAGTIPQPSSYRAFAEQCAAYVVGSRGCTRWIIGNEPNHSQEWPDGMRIDPLDYARCYTECMFAVKAVQSDAQVLVAAVAPWNVEAGDWLQYWRRVLNNLNAGADGFAVHSYIHGNNPDLVNSDAKMDMPYQDRHFEFNAYRDLLNAIPEGRGFRSEIFMTEANPLPGWQATGVVPAMLANVEWWNNQPGTQPVQCVCFYRYPDYDRWGMASKPDVQAEFQAAAQRYPAPKATTQNDNTSTPSTPPDPTPAGPATSPVWDPRLDGLGVQHKPVSPAPGVTAYRLIEAQWFDVAEAQGRVNVFVDVLDEAGNRLPVPVRFWWGGGGPGESDTKTIELDKRDSWASYGVDFNMTRAGHSFSIAVDDNGHPSDAVVGMGLGTVEERHTPHHTAFRLVFQRARDDNPEKTQETDTVLVPDVSTVPTNPSTPSSVPRLVHPVENPAYRRVTQPFGVNPERYARFNLDGHNGIDFATPVGARIRAAADGVAVEVLNDAPGYGLYVKLRHPWGESLYAHLSQQLVAQGESVRAGQVIGLSGNTGNSTGPHLHFGMRVFPYTRGRPFDGYTDPAPYLQEAIEPGNPAPPLVPQGIVATLREAAREFGVEEELLLSLAWAESSYNPLAVSSAGAQGLLQIMPPTWKEWAPKVGASQPLNLRDNARVGAAYLKWCIETADSVRRGLWAYVWGIGRVLDLGKPGRPTQPPAEVLEYANKIIHGRDLLKAVMG